MGMSMEESLLRVLSARSAGDWLTRPLRALWERCRMERKIRRQIQELRRCDERILRDIGIRRWEIEAVVRGSGSPAGRWADGVNHRRDGIVASARAARRRYGRRFA